MTLILYHSPASPFSRSVLLLLKYLNVDVEVKVLDLREKQEHLSEEFLKINPQHCVPTIDDNGFILWESRAILAYIMETRAPRLVPTSPKEKAIISQRLYNEMGNMTETMGGILIPVMRQGATEFPQDKIKKLYEMFETIDEHYFPSGNVWIAGENVSVADFAYVSTISTMVAMGASLDKFPRLKAWFEQCKTTFPEYHEVNEVGANLLAQFVLSKVTKGF